MAHVIRQYRLEAGALEVQYIEECFPEFRAKKGADEIIARLGDREHLILLSMAPSPDGDGRLIPVAFKVGHELRAAESQGPLRDLVEQISDCVDFEAGRVFYSWIGGTRSEWRGQGHYRALTEQQEEWALRHGYRSLIVKTKNKFYSMRAALDHLHFDVIKFLPHPEAVAESKVYLGKRIGTDLLRKHRTERSLVEAA
jgi:GNAT superfamily N-acetyltransferase